jgi:hypothetical protein
VIFFNDQWYADCVNTVINNHNSNIILLILLGTTHHRLFSSLCCWVCIIIIYLIVYQNSKFQPLRHAYHAILKFPFLWLLVIKWFIFTTNYHLARNIFNKTFLGKIKSYLLVDVVDWTWKIHSPSSGIFVCFRKTFFCKVPKEKFVFKISVMLYITRMKQDKTHDPTKVVITIFLI